MNNDDDAPLSIPDSVWGKLETEDINREMDRATRAREAGIDPDSLCHANKHLWADYVEMVPIPGTDNYEPYCRGCEERVPSAFDA